MTIDGGPALGFDIDLAVRAIAAADWATIEPLAWTGRIRDGGEVSTIVVPIGFVTDFATVPRFLQWLFRPYGPYTRAAVLHDYLLTELAGWTRRHLGNVVRSPIDGSDDRPPATSREADTVFRVAMRDLGTPAVVRWPMWAAVRLAALFNHDRAYRREFAKDAPAVLGIAALAVVPVVVGSVGPLLVRSLIKVLTVLSGGRPAVRRTGRGVPGGSRLMKGKP